LGLLGLEGRIAGDLPGGFRQRLALACAISHGPKVLFLDEPTAGVDPAARRSFWSIIQSLAAEGMTIFVTTHYMDEAEYAGRLAFIYNGKIVALDTPERLQAEALPTIRPAAAGDDGKDLPGQGGLPGGAVRQRPAHLLPAGNGRGPQDQGFAGRSEIHFGTDNALAGRCVRGADRPSLIQ
jgi:energy-coupling factor transporter ATP-binding protein EcfA2